MARKHSSAIMVPARHATRGLRVGLLGGSFNPAHAGHRHVSVVALRRLRLDEVWWLVSPQNPLKGRDETAPLRLRVEQARKIARHPRIRVVDIEARLGMTYTADTLKWLSRQRPRHRFVWLMGADNLRQIHAWRRWRAIFQTMPVAILNRPSYGLRALFGPAARRFRQSRQPERGAAGLADRSPPAWIFLRHRLHPASATAIRSARGGSFKADES